MDNNENQKETEPEIKWEKPYEIRVLKPKLIPVKPKEDSEYETLLLTKNQARVLSLMRQHPDWRQRNISQEMHISQGKVSQLIKSMRRNNPCLIEEIITFNKSLSVDFYKIRRDTKEHKRKLY